MLIPRDVPRDEKVLAKAKTEAMNKFLRDYDDFLDHYHSTSDAYHDEWSHLRWWHTPTPEVIGKLIRKELSKGGPCDQQLILNLEID